MGTKSDSGRLHHLAGISFAHVCLIVIGISRSAAQPELESEPTQLTQHYRSPRDPYRAELPIGTLLLHL